MKKNLYNIIAFFLVFSFLILCLFYYNSNLFIKNADKKRLDYLVFLNSHIEKLDKISSSSDFKKESITMISLKIFISKNNIGS